MQTSPNDTTTSPRSGALAGLKVVDLSRVLAGPLCTLMLGDHGATVIKVEPPRGDDTRDLGPPFYGDTAAYYHGVNRNKLGIGLDLTQPVARDVLLRMLEDADVLVENFLPGTMERWGIGYEQTLAARFPRLVYCRISGFGEGGPLGGQPGYDAIAQAFAGLMSVNGSTVSGPLRVGVPVADILTGMHAFAGILLALAERHASGRGQAVEATLYDSALSIFHPHSESYFGSGRAPGLMGNAHANIAPYDTFATGEGPIFLGILNDGQFAKLVAHLGRPALARDPRFADNAARVAHRDALKATLEELLAGHAARALSPALMAIGVPAAPVHTMSEAFEHPHTVARGMTVEVDGKRALGVPVKLGRTPGAPRRGAPVYGEHTREVLAASGFDAAAIDALIAAGAALVARRK
jgi:crotonobetainyl-CoA:carnitine CoA-transferase CaiB-like acyl-CoA transferase